MSAVPPVEYNGLTSDEAAAAAGEAAAAKVVAAVAEEDANSGGPRVVYPDALVAQVIVQHLKQQQADVAIRQKCAAYVPPAFNREVRLALSEPGVCFRTAYFP